MDLPIIDISPLRTGTGDRGAVAKALGIACRESGFFYLTGHSLAPALIAELHDLSCRFFALPDAQKQELAMARGGRAWRGYFPVGGELTSGQPDLKEGLYFGAELGPDHPRVQAGTPLHGRSLFPPSLPRLRPVVLAYMEAMTQLGHTVMEGIAESLGLAPGYFRDDLTRDPMILFRIFHYPPSDRTNDWGVGEHTDYGLLTLLLQEDIPGLQVKTPSGWLEAPPIPGTLVCNLGDMLERMTYGGYRSTPHRVRNASSRNRLSFPFFFDPGWDAEVRPVLPGESYDDRLERWDGVTVYDLPGRYGDYLLAKVARVFPALRNEALDPAMRRPTEGY